MISLRSPMKLTPSGRDLRGNVLVLSAFLLVVVLSMAAVAIDIGYISLTRAQLQNAADAAALGAAAELVESFGVGATVTPEVALMRARRTAANLLAMHRNVDREQIPFSAEQDLQVGNRQWDVDTGEAFETWDEGPYNLLQINANRLAAEGTGLHLFLGSFAGRSQTDLQVRAVAGLRPVAGIRLPPGATGTLNVLPFTVDLESWECLLNTQLGNRPNGAGGQPLLRDDYSYNKFTDTVLSGPDGVYELNIYPHTNNKLPAGNRGTCDLGSPNNSTADLRRQILYGLNANDLSYFPGSTLSVEDGPLMVQGDTGVSAGMKDALESIVGQKRMIPVFSNVYGNGNNAQYEVVKFVGVRIMSVAISGSPAHRRLIVQPTPMILEHGVPGNIPWTVDSLMTPPRLLR